MRHKAIMSPGEEKVLKHLNRVGYAHITELRLRYKVSRFRIHQLLTGLHKMGLVNRDVQGMAISLEWLAKHPQEKQSLERLLKLNLV